MADYTNFFETKKEAEMRLRGTIVLYDGKPYYVLCIGDHKPDGIFRIYLDPLGSGMAINNYNLPEPYGEQYDAFMANNPSSPIIRKMMNSPSFNKFRPFPLGMCNTSKSSFYIERSPTRKTEQGLTQNMLCISSIKLLDGQQGGVKPGHHFNFYGDEFKACIVGDYPSAHACLAALKNPKVTNDAAAFHREFAFVRGPLNTLYLGYKDNVIGLLPNRDLSAVQLGAEYGYTKEVVEGLNLFGSVQIQA